jgi:uncharacterized protein (TIGR02246 family)
VNRVLPIGLYVVLRLLRSGARSPRHHGINAFLMFRIVRAGLLVLALPPWPLRWLSIEFLSWHDTLPACELPHCQWHSECSCKPGGKTMADEVVEKEILQLEKRYWQAVKDRDIATAESLTDDPCLVAGSTGVSSVSKENFRKIMQSAKYTLHDFTLQNAEVRRLSDNVAVVAYKMHEELTVDQKPVSIDSCHSSTWVKRDGRWVCALHTESLAGDPYGRDRKQAA